MARVGTCQACGARFKVPETTKATRAKCSKCGGVVQIPPAGAGAASAKKPREKAPEQAAPSRAKAAPAAKGAGRKPAGAPARRAAAAPGVSRRKGREASETEPSGAAAGRREKSAGKGAGRARSSGRASGRRGGSASKGAGEKQEKKKPILLFVILAVVILGAAGWFVFGRGGDEPAIDEAATTDTTDDAATTDEDAEAAEVIATPDPDLIAPDTPEEAAAPAEAPAAQAAAPVAEPEPEGPLDPVLAFEPVPVWPGVTQEQHDEWANLIHSYFMAGEPPRVRKGLRVQLEEMDPIDAIPAFINNLIGLDMADDIPVRNAWDLVEYWQKRVAKVPHFSFLDMTRMEQDDIDKRVKVVREWKKWAEAKMADPAAIEKYRLDVAAALESAAAEDG